jgi:hypothetical protein
MEYKTIEKREGCDVGWHGSNIQPRGIDKSYTLDMVINLAYKMDDKPNIIIKAGKNAKWYMKKVPLHKIDDAIEKQQWRDTSRSTMYIIGW